MTVRNLDRRRFLRMASMGAMASTGLATTGLAEPVSRDPPVLIIGAGMAGIAASFWLRQFGISSLILEGRNRLGGRIDTSTYWPDATLDLGAAWIHDAPHSPLTPLATLFGIGLFQTNLGDFQMFGLQDQLLPLLFPPPSAASTLLDYQVVISLVNNIANLLARSGFPDQPIGNVVNWVLNALQPWDPEALAGVQSWLDQQVRSHSGANLQEISLYYYDANKNITSPETIDLAFPKGFIQLINALAKAGGQPIETNCVVKKISYNAQGVTAFTSQGTFTARYAIITLPIGVLQRSQGASPLVQFDPPLPDWKLGAVNRLGMGKVDKLFLRFPLNFWGSAQALLRNTNPPSQWTEWLNLTAMLNNIPILGAGVFADQAKQLEALPDDKVVSMMMGVLKPWFAAQNPASNVPDPVNKGFLRSNWGTDPFAFGCWSFFPPGSSPVDRDILSLPVPFSLVPTPSQRLFFAGEATDRDHPASVWGAYVSGLREAYRISIIASLLEPFRKQAGAANYRRLLKGKFSPITIWRTYDHSMKEANRRVGRDQAPGK